MALLYLVSRKERSSNETNQLYCVKTCRVGKGASAPCAPRRAHAVRMQDAWARRTRFRALRPKRVEDARERALGPPYETLLIRRRGEPLGISPKEGVAVRA